MITEDYVSFETAKLLKKNGFDEKCFSFYWSDGSLDANSHDNKTNLRNSTSHNPVAPTLQMAMKWLREVHNLFIEPTAGENDGKFWYDFDIMPVNGRNIEWDFYENIPTDEYSSPEEACEAAIRYCLENLI